MKKRPDETSESPDTARKRDRIREVLEHDAEEEREFLESCGTESIEALVRDSDAVMMALNYCGTSEGLEDIEPPLFGRILCALAAVPEWAQMIVESEDDNSFRDAIGETPKAKRSLYLAQLEGAVAVARSTMARQPEKRRAKKKAR